MEDEVMHPEELTDEIGVLGRIVVGAARVTVAAQLAWARVKHAVATVLGGAVDQMRFMLDPGADDPDELEREQLRASALAVTRVLGEDPVERVKELAPEARIDAMAELAQELCSVLGIEAPTLVQMELEEGTWGACEAKSGVMALNSALTTSDELSDWQAAQLIDTVCHELYHLFQYHACRLPSRYGISKAQARIWRINFKHYVGSEVNPRRYWSQPIEVCARMYANSVLAVLGIEL